LADVIVMMDERVDSNEEYSHRSSWQK